MATEIGIPTDRRFGQVICQCTAMPLRFSSPCKPAEIHDADLERDLRKELYDKKPLPLTSDIGVPSTDPNNAVIGLLLL